MVKTIQPNGCSSSVSSTPISKKSSSKNNDFELCTNQFIYSPSSSQQIQAEQSTTNAKSSVLSNILSIQKPPPTTNNYADVKMAAQHREIERLVESRQRLHTIKDQIASLHQSMTTPPIQPEKDLTNESKAYQNKLNYSTNIRPSYSFNHQDDNDSELCGIEFDSDDDDNTSDRIQTKPSFSNKKSQPRIKQSVS